MKLIIFGAQGYALGAYEAVKTLYPEHEILFFMVSSKENNAPVLAGLPVREISSVLPEMSEEERKSVKVLIATPDNVQPEIVELLERYGFTNNKRLDSDGWADLMERFHAKTGKFQPLGSLMTGPDLAKLCVFAARSHKDKALGSSAVLSGYVCPLQVGKALCDESIAELSDDTGDNISQKNGNYSELTGLYWIWKNRLCKEDSSDKDGHDYFGLAQYRRMLVLSEDNLRWMKENDIDVVLPYPLPYDPDINAHHERYLKETDWNALLRALKEIQPEYADAFPEVLRQRYLFNYNVITAKRSVLNEYCSWLFPILERTEEYSVPKGCDRSDRYIGYMGETLETLYFMKNAERLNIALAECRMYI
ncbi:MAG: DUF4422 domain-containing protein [Lachnospiraceae bacterium]|nr:DUF4422 domain-containing protein [Lachnospiraceae bacterium]